MIEITIIIPTYNRPDYLARALASCIAQEGVGATFEILVVDNNPDGSAKPQVETMAQRSAVPVRYVHEPRAGISHARNTGVAAAAGRYIAFVDDDQEVDPGCLAALLAAIRRFGADAVFGAIYPMFPVASVHPYAREKFTRDVGRPTGTPIPAGSPMRKITAALSAGCSIVIKASEETPGTACEIVRCFDEAGVPAGVLNLVFGEPAEVSAHLIASPAIRLVAFTGSIPVGKLLAAAAGSQMKPCLMELGGHAPVIVCADADPVAAARKTAFAKFINAGQVCTSPSRLLVHESLYDAFVAEFLRAVDAVVVGDGLDDGVTMGPMANPRRVKAMEELVTDAVSRGAKVLRGGERLDRAGFFFAPTVLTGVAPDSRVMQEEPFGPLAPIVPFADLDDALRVANSLPYGLAAYGFTRSSATAERLVRSFEAGILSINHCGGSVHEAPSGGVKSSGYGREGGPEGVDGYLVTKRVSHLLAD